MSEPYLTRSTHDLYDRMGEMRIEVQRSKKDLHAGNLAGFAGRMAKLARNLRALANEAERLATPLIGKVPA